MHALTALFHALDTQPEIPVETASRILFLRAQAHPGLEAFKDRLTCEQTWKPHADALVESGQRHTRQAEGKYDLILLLPDRQRDSILSDFARAHELLAEGGMLVTALHNDWGAKRMEQHLAEVAGEVQTLSKHHSRVFWATQPASWKTEVLEQWKAGGAMRRVLDGRFWSQPGLFNWDRIDEGSALLTEHLPHTIGGNVADLGASWGYLSDHLLRKCPNIRTLDMYEADARALECARRNTGLIPVPVRPRILWKDVTQGVGTASYDHVVMNPPFHDGRDADPTLGLKFITVAAQALRTTGDLWLVANKHLPYENLLREAFEHISLIAETRSFKVIHGVKPTLVTRQVRRKSRR
ncbi:16S rRNA m(2)G 1207 methyltransferase [Prosthecobacter debontii]|uniref:16S rRNA m(2)G 1207 methyltransferase n=1 Tax=Prosthecobacter debontii TaxID=48467 RepID=A0A1T4YZN5_9BACT|nr:methyltransferase [Prosthecobacter debontii]SKB07259.1 16S rRNA m(2)G 1207 methyltransferase [Prosthecobacter debontii]